MKFERALALVLAIASVPSLAAAQIEEAQATGECPGFVRGSKLSVENVKQGVVVTVTTTTFGHVEPLRALLYVVADAVEKDSEVPEAQQVAATGGAIPPLDLKATDVAGGLQIIVLAKNIADVAELQEQAVALEMLWLGSPCVTGKPPI